MSLPGMEELRLLSQPYLLSPSASERTWPAVYSSQTHMWGNATVSLGGWIMLYKPSRGSLARSRSRVSNVINQLMALVARRRTERGTWLRHAADSIVFVSAAYGKSNHLRPSPIGVTLFHHVSKSSRYGVTGIGLGSSSARVRCGMQGIAPLSRRTSRRSHIADV